MIPHERSLVEKWKDKPFVILGVNSDGTDTEDGLKKFREMAKADGVTWRSFRDEGSTPRISETWRVQGWPTLYFLDHEGVIQHKDLRDDAEMEKALEAMIAVAEAAAKAPATPAEPKAGEAKKPAEPKKAGK
jgi:hypothetical protein